MHNMHIALTNMASRYEKSQIEVHSSCQIVTNTASIFITGIYLMFRRRQSREYCQIIAEVSHNQAHLGFVYSM